MNKIVTEEIARATFLQRLATSFTNWAERWFPDAYIFALFALALASVAAILIGGKPVDVANAFGDGYWNLIKFTYQMAMVLIAGFALAKSDLVRSGLNKLAAIPKTGPGAIVFIVLVSIAANLLNWGFGMVLSAMLVLALAGRQDLRMDFRAAAAAALVGTATLALLGLSSGPALLQANAASMPPELMAAGGVIPTTQTIFAWQNGVVILVITLASAMVAFLTAPRGRFVKTAQDLNIDLVSLQQTKGPAQQEARRPGDWFSNTPVIALALAALCLAWLGLRISSVGFVAMISDLNNYIFVCLTLALLLHGRIKNFLDAIYAAVPSVGPILIQFPIYAATAAIITTVKNPAGHSVASYLGDFFVRIGGEYGLPLVVGVYSILMGFFVPAAGARWVLEAPYVFHAGQATESNLGWLLVVFNGSEALTNFLNPFWMLPILGLLMLKPKNIVGYTFLYFVCIAPLMLGLLWALSFTLPYLPPVMQ